MEMDYEARQAARNRIQQALETSRRAEQAERDARRAQIKSARDRNRESNTKVTRTTATTSRRTVPDWETVMLRSGLTGEAAKSAARRLRLARPGAVIEVDGKKFTVRDRGVEVHHRRDNAPIRTIGVAGFDVAASFGLNKKKRQ